MKKGFKLLSLFLAVCMMLTGFEVSVISNRVNAITTLCSPLPSAYPLTVRTTNYSSGHPGIDIAAPQGTDIYSVEAGVVIVAQWNDSYGNYVVIKHSDSFFSVYAHQVNGGICVSVGQSVARGQLIGHVGTTGNSTGPHLHFELRHSSSYSNFIDPTPGVNYNYSYYQGGQTAPTDVWVRVPDGEESSYLVNSDVRISFGATNAQSYHLDIWKKTETGADYYYGESFISSTGSSYCPAKFSQPGHYSCTVTASNAFGETTSSWLGWDIVDAAPSGLEIITDKSLYSINEPIIISLNALYGYNKHIGIHRIEVTSEDSLCYEQDVKGDNCIVSITESGNYKVNFDAFNAAGFSRSEFAYFSVYDLAPSTPILSMQKNNFQLNEEISLNIAIPSGSIDCYLSVKNKENDVAVIGPGEKLDNRTTQYIFKLDKVGKYYVEYQTRNELGSSPTARIDFSISCIHKWNDGKITTPATCTAAGVKTFICTTCGHSYTEAIPATGVHTDANKDNKCDGCGKTMLAVTAQPKSATVTAGTNATFSVTAAGEGLTYAWYYKDPGQSSFSKSASVNSSVIYTTSAERNGRQVYCVVTDKYGNSVQSNTVTLTVISPAKITAQPKSATVAAGTNAAFSVTAAGEGLTYAWYYKDPGQSSFSKSASANSSVIYTTSADRNGRQIYCVVTDKYGNSVQSNTVTLTVISPAKITAQPKSATVAAGTNAAFSVTAAGEELTYAWYYKDPGQSSFSKSASTINTVTYKTSADRNGRQIYCVVTDKYGNTAKSDTVTLTIVSSLKITAQPTNKTVNSGDLAAFAVTATGEGLTYAWYYKDPGQSSFTKSASATDTVTYKTPTDRNGRQIYCVVTDKYGNSVQSNTVTMTVISGPTITAQPKSVTVNAGTNATFSVTATGTGLTYAWYYKDPGATMFTKSASTASSVTYTTSAARNGRQVYCVVMDQEGNTVKSNTVTLTVN